MGLRIVLMGAPGAGKGTQARRISECRRVPHISTGDIFRRHIESSTEIGSCVSPYLANGQLAPDGMALTVVADRLKEPDCIGGYVLDGFPRSPEQARCFDEILDQRGEKLTHVINIVTDDEEIVERLGARRVCPQCGAVYNRKSNAPRVENSCDSSQCNGVRLIQRADDSEDIIRDRLRLYHEITEPVLEFYRDSGILHHVGGKGSTPDQIFARIQSLIGGCVAETHP